VVEKLKTCYKCGEIKPIGMFIKTHRKEWQCKECVKKTKEKRLQYLREYYEKNKERKFKQRFEYVKNNKEKVEKIKKEWLEKNKYQLKEKKREYREAHKDDPEYKRRVQESNIKYREKKKLEKELLNGIRKV